MGDFKDDFENWVKLIEEKRFNECELPADWTPKYSEITNEHLAHTDNVNFEKWVDEFKPNNMGIFYNEFISSFKNAFDGWIKIHRAIYKKGDSTKSGDFYLDAEEDLGVYFRNFAAS